MRRFFLLALLAGCGPKPPIPKTDLLLDITPGTLEVQPGEPFPLTVTRVWQKDLVPSEWSDKALAPLAVRLEEETRRDDGARIEETRRYVAHAFSLKDVLIRGVKLVALPKDGGPERKVSATGFRIRVRPALDPEDPGPPELPGEPPASRGWMWGGAGAFVLLAFLFLALRRKARPVALVPEPAPPPPEVAPHERALERLRRLAAVEGAADVLREFLLEAKGIRALEKTTEELLRVVPAPSLAKVLTTCDLGKFAALALTPPERADVLASAEAFVREVSR